MVSRGRAGDGVVLEARILESLFPVSHADSSSGLKTRKLDPWTRDRASDGRSLAAPTFQKITENCYTKGY